MKVLIPLHTAKGLALFHAQVGEAVFNMEDVVLLLISHLSGIFCRIVFIPSV